MKVRMNCGNKLIMTHDVTLFSFKVLEILIFILSQCLRDILVLDNL